MKKDKSKTTMLTISTGFLVLYLAFEIDWAVKVSLIAGLTGIFSNYLSKKIEYIWMQVAKILSFIIPNILLTIVFFFFLFPISLISKIFKKDSLMLKNKYSSIFNDVERKLDKSSFEKTW
ncbi:MAG: hypothetical protein R6V47_04740 [Candidatus Delongbacteria bacterium]